MNRKKMYLLGQSSVRARSHSYSQSYSQSAQSKRTIKAHNQSAQSKRGVNESCSLFLILLIKFEMVLAGA
jgi:hypothetical protein